LVRFAGDVAHELNNLLTVLGTSARLVRESVRDALPPSLAAEAEVDFDAIEHAVRRAGVLTGQLLACSRARAAEPGPTAVTGAPGGVGYAVTDLR